MPDQLVAQEARSIALAVEQKLDEREKLHDERNAALIQSIKEIKSILTWVGGTMITMILSVLAWSLLQQYNANEAQQRALQEQVYTLQHQPVPADAASKVN